MDEKTTMTIIQAIILGIVQGITEFLPISSSGHLIIFPYFFGWEEQGLDFDVMMHLATLLAVLFVLRADIVHILKRLFSKNSEWGSLGWKIALATIPVVLVGLFLSSGLLTTLRDIRFVAINLILWGVILSLADFVMTKKKLLIESVEKSSWTQTFLIGCAQAFALIPGTSRSGSTMSMALFAGLNRKTAAKFSFLLGIPAILGAGIMTLTDVLETGFSTSLIVIAAGFLAAFLSGILAIRLLLALLEKISFHWFAGYRIILGIVLLLLVYLD